MDISSNAISVGRRLHGLQAQRRSSRAGRGYNGPGLPYLRECLTVAVADASQDISASHLVSLSPITSSIEQSRKNALGLWKILCQIIEVGIRYKALSPAGYFHSHGTVKLSIAGGDYIARHGRWKNGGLLLWTRFGGVHFKAIDDHYKAAQYITSPKNMPDVLFLQRNIRLHHSYNHNTPIPVTNRFRILRAALRNKVDSAATHDRKGGAKKYFRWVICSLAYCSLQGPVTCAGRPIRNGSIYTGAGVVMFNNLAWVRKPHRVLRPP